jgi:hypothetical protein
LTSSEKGRLRRVVSQLVMCAGRFPEREYEHISEKETVRWKSAPQAAEMVEATRLPFRIIE